MEKLRKKKQKKFKSAYQKRINIAFVFYTVYICLCISLLWISFAVPRDKFELALYIILPIAAAFFIGGSLAMVFLVSPYLRKLQARIDFARCDFSPYTADGTNEVFEHEYHMSRYIAHVGPFDNDESITLVGEKALNEYLEQYKVWDSENYYISVYDSPFFVGYFFGEDKIKFRIDKKVTNDTVTLDVYELHRVEFTENGIIIGDELYPFSDIETEVIAYCNRQTDFTVCIRIVMLFSDEGILSFQISSRIAEIVKKFGIEITNRETFDYIVKNPERAFEQTAIQLELKKLK